MSFQNPNLLQKIQNGQFITVNPFFEPLQKILEELYNLIQSQQAKIVQMENEMKQKADQGSIPDLQNINDAIVDIQKSISDANTQIQNHDVLISELQNSTVPKDELSKLEQKIQELQKDNNNIHQKLEQHQDSISTNETLLQSAQKAIDALKNDVNLISSEEKATKALAHSNQQRITDLENKLQTVESKFDSALGNINSSINDMTLNIDDLNSKYEDIQNRVEGLEDSINQPSNVVSREIPSGLSNNSNNSYSDNDMKKLEKRIQSLESKLHLLESNLRSYQSKPITPPNDQPQSKRNILHTSDNNNALPNLTSPDALAAVSQLRYEVLELKKKMANDEDEYKDQFSSISKQFDELNDQIQKMKADLANRPDKAYIERLFDKFKETLNNVIGMIQGSKNKPKTPNPKGYATHADIARLEKMIQQTSYEFEETAAARKSSKCLCCGQSYRAISGGIQDQETLAVLGAAPIVHVAHDNQKPCFVYGSDHELYYSSSPRGRTFAQKSSSSKN